MPALYWILGFIAIQRLAELVIARRNTLRLLAEGGREVGASHYPVMVALHTLWLIAMAVFISAAEPIWWPALIFFIALQFARIWVIGSLGRYWTTRVITVDVPLVVRGPYRWFRHPNYVVVVAEIAVVPMIFLAYEISVVFSILNGLLLMYRIKIENEVLIARPGS